MRDDTGAAIPEFIVVTVGIMIPLAYVIIALADVLGALSAAQSAVREASRVYSRDISSASREYRAGRLPRSHSPIVISISPRNP